MSSISPAGSKSLDRMSASSSASSSNSSSSSTRSHSTKGAASSSRSSSGSGSEVSPCSTRSSSTTHSSDPLLKRTKTEVFPVSTTGTADWHCPFPAFPSSSALHYPYSSHDVPVGEYRMSPTVVPVLSAAPKQMHELEESCCVRMGVFRPRTGLTREQVIDEIDSIKLTSKVEHVILEGGGPAAVGEEDFEWGRAYFSSAELSELCAALLCYPGRRSKWSRVIIQRLPVRSSPLTLATEAGLGEVNQPAVVDTMLVCTADGYSVVNTGEVYRTKAIDDYTSNRRMGVIIPVNVCEFFYPDPGRNKCSKGVSCECVHLLLEAFPKLLLHVLPLVIDASDRGGSAGGCATAGLPVHCAWELDRRADTLVLHRLGKHIDLDVLRYMFCRCDGFINAQTVVNPSSVRYGVVQFDSHVNAVRAKEQASVDADLLIAFYGEPRPYRRLLEGGSGECDTHGEQSVDGAAGGDHPQRPPQSLAESAAGGGDKAPFPPLPEGWECGLSRRTMQYFFIQPGTKKATTWKHPTTNERYFSRKT